MVKGSTDGGKQVVDFAVEIGVDPTSTENGLFDAQNDLFQSRT